MSRQLIDRNADLHRLKIEGYDVGVLPGFVVVRQVPYVTAKKTIKLGVLISEATVSGETIRPRDHVALFAGEYPCHENGAEIDQIRNGPITQSIGGGLTANYRFSAKPKPSGVYADHYHKMATYMAYLTGPARLIDPTATAQIFPPSGPSELESVFLYDETASGRAGITGVTDRLKIGKVAIIGLGGTGSYVLDFICKTPAGQIHLFDGDRFFNHNAFRSPGAATFEELNSGLLKVAYYKQKYSLMRRGIVEHGYYVDQTNVNELCDMDFVFMCLDQGDPKHLIVEKLEEFSIPFVDTGMGIKNVDDSLTGVLRTTLSTPERRGHFRSRVSFADPDDDNDYSRNIQIAELNALNAIQAVIQYKKYLDFYHNFGNEHNSNYCISTNALCNEDVYEA